MNEIIIKIAKTIKNCGGRLYLVGGAVRDEIRGVEPKDFDFCIVGISERRAKEIISSFFQEPCVNVISNAPVFNCAGYEFAMARIEKQVHGGKSGFEFISNPNITLFEDLKRRDFTAGAIAKDILTGEIIDPFNGVQDIKNKILRAVDPETFVQSPERAFRAFSQSARFGWDIEHYTVELIETKMIKDFDTIPTEQLWLHFNKAATSFVEAKNFFYWMWVTDWVNFFPEILPEREPDKEFDTVMNALESCNTKTQDRDIWFFTALCVNMDSKEREQFFDRISAPKKIRRLVGEFHRFGGHKPARLVEGRDIMHIVNPGKQMGRLVLACFDKQIEYPEMTKEDLIYWAEKLFGEI